MSDGSAYDVLASQTDPERFVALVDEHGEAVLRYLTRRVGPDTAEDLTAETFLIAFQKRHSYIADAEVRSALPWLYGIATNLLHSHGRSEQRRAVMLGRLAAQAIIDDDPEGIDEALSAAATVRRFGDAIANLPPDGRDVLLLIATEGLSYAETAAALKIPIGTVRSRLSRVRAQLQRALSAHPNDPKTVETLLGEPK